MAFKVVEMFDYKERTCVIVEVDYNINLFLTMADGNPGEYHNGYASVKEENHGSDYDEFSHKISVDELTYSGSLEEFPEVSKGLWFIGFDSAHYWNNKDPESKTLKSVKKRLKKMVDEMVESKI